LPLWYILAALAVATGLFVAFKIVEKIL